MKVLVDRGMLTDIFINSNYYALDYKNLSIIVYILLICKISLNIDIIIE
jgi:hypothetical protein